MSDPTFVGSEPSKPSFEEDLGIESNSNLMEQEAASLAGENDLGATSNNFMEPIGESEPPLPPPPEPIEEPKAIEQVEQPQSVKEETGNYLSADEKEQLIKKLAEGTLPTPPLAPKPVAEPMTATASGQSTQSNEVDINPLPDSVADLPAPQISERGRGVAYFYRNYVQIIGSQTIHAGDDITLADRTYELKPKKIDSKVLIGSAAGVLALLLIVIISQFVAVDTGQGQIFGVVLDDAGRPYVQGATVRLAELGKSIRTNPQGVFIFEDVPAGTHQLEYRVDGAVVGTDYATVVNNESSLLVLHPTEETVEMPSEETRPQAQIPSSENRADMSAPQSSQPKSSNQSSSDSGRKKSKSKTDTYAKLSLQTNVEGARLKLNGDIIGAGNMTFSKLSPGTYSYVVDAQGYNPSTGTITLKAGQTEALILDLQTMSQEQLRNNYTAQDFYVAGQNAAREGNFTQAVTDFSNAVTKDANFADAYKARAGLQQKQGNNQQAYNDYVRAGKCYLAQRNANDAISAYNSAIEIDPGSIDAYLGRGDVYLAMGQQIAALADFDMAVDINDDNPRGHYGLGRARFDQGNYKKAAKHFDKARDLDPSNAYVYQYLMLSYAAMDDEKKVKKSFEKFREIATNEQIEEILTSSEYSSVSEIIQNN